MIRFVWFDYDGVLTRDRTGSLTTCRSIAAASGIPLDRVRAAFAAHNDDLTLGRTTHEQVWPQICSALDVALPFALLQRAFDSTPVSAPMFALARRLRSACGIGILSDNKADRMQRLRVVQGLDDVFDPIMVSAEVGCSKQSTSMFERAVLLTGVAAGDSLLIDNVPENVARAESVGMHGVHFDDARNDVDALADRLARGFALPARVSS